MEQEKSIFKRVVDSFKKDGFKKTLYKSFKFIKETGIFSFSNDVRAFWLENREIPNFGDMLTPYLIEKLTGKKPYLVNKYCYKDHYLIAGSIFNKANKNSIVFGSGIMRRKEKIKKPKKILVVRGPLTRKRLIELGYECPKIFGDPALLLPLLYKSKIDGQYKKYKIGIIPHFIDYNYVKNQLYKNKGILIINLLNPIEKVVDDIVRCNITISSSLHGLITSHAYNIPSLWVKFSDNLFGDDTKFYDYLYSVKIQLYEPLDFRSYFPTPEEIEANFRKKENLINVGRDTIRRLQKNLLNLWPLPKSVDMENIFYKEQEFCFENKGSKTGK
jgi:pyruvyltransferase